MGLFQEKEKDEEEDEERKEKFTSLPDMKGWSR